MTEKNKIMSLALICFLVFSCKRDLKKSIIEIKILDDTIAYTEDFYIPLRVSITNKTDNQLSLNSFFQIYPTFKTPRNDLKDKICFNELIVESKSGEKVEKSEAIHDYFIPGSKSRFSYSNYIDTTLLLPKLTTVNEILLTDIGKINSVVASEEQKRGVTLFLRYRYFIPEIGTSNYLEGTVISNKVVFVRKQ
ncbi:MAG TPA: hypothetical protein PKN75_15275 [Bacteroidia bacterium]|nr:hypothetical protein [Bacteroidia bacterium]HNU34947.1 hypothetical protein [Bacteroidia bacterium]